MKTIQKSRFDTRLSKQQKEYFEYAASLGGFRTLTDFVISAAQLKANEIIAEHNSIINSQRDKTLFFDALVNPPKANADIKNAAKKYRKLLGQK